MACNCNKDIHDTRSSSTHPSKDKDKEEDVVMSKNKKKRKEKEASRMPMPRKVASTTNNVPATAVTVMTTAISSVVVTTTRPLAISKLQPGAPAECAHISFSEHDEDERERILTAAWRRRNKLVYRLQQQIRQQEIELANKMKESEAKRKNDASSEFVGPGRKSNAICQCCKRRCNR